MGAAASDAVSGDVPEPAAPSPRRPDTRDPRGSRLVALRVLHEADVRGEDPAAVLARWDEVEAPAARAREGRVDADPDLGPVVADVFARGLIAGVAARRDELDARIGKVSHAWRVERMPVVDRNVLRLAVHELLHESTPVAVVLDEAVRLVGELSTDASGRFVNGVLAAILRDLGRAPDPAGD